MKKLILLFLAALLCLTAVGCSSCSEPESGARRMEFVDAETYRLFDGAGNAVRTYHRASYAYLPRHMLRDAWAVCTYQAANGGMNTHTFFATEEASADKFLVMADPDDYYPYFFVTAEGYTLPTLAEMKPTTVVVCGTDEDLFWMASNVLDYIYLQENIDTLVSHFTLNSTAELPSGAPVAAAEMIVSSENCPEFSFYCTAYLFADGTAYLHDAASGKTVTTSADLLKQYYPFKTDAV